MSKAFTDQLRKAARAKAHAAMFKSLPLVERLERTATKRLAKAKFYPKRQKLGLLEAISAEIDSAVEADAIGSNGQLRPTWQGRA